MSINHDNTKATVKAIERLLFEHANTDTRIEAMQIEKELIENDYDTLHGVSGNKIKPSTSTNQIGSTVENNLISKESRVAYLNEKIKKEQFNKRMIDNAMNALNESDRKFIEDRYFRKIGPKTLADTLYYCTDSWIFIRSKNIIKEQLSKYIRIIK